jgi:hypothetical protein
MYIPCQKSYLFNIHDIYGNDDILIYANGISIIFTATGLQGPKVYSSTRVSVACNGKVGRKLFLRIFMVLCIFSSQYCTFVILKYLSTGLRHPGVLKYQVCYCIATWCSLILPVS